MLRSNIRIIVTVFLIIFGFIMLSSAYLGIPKLSDVILTIAASFYMIFGITMAIISVLRNTKRQSPIKVGAITRAEFYGVIIALISWIFIINNRIDQIMLILMQR